MTNLEYIRSATDEQLVKVLVGITDIDERHYWQDDIHIGYCTICPKRDKCLPYPEKDCTEDITTEMDVRGWLATERVNEQEASDVE